MLGGQVRYAAIWEARAGSAWVAYHDLDTLTHEQRFSQYVMMGYRPVNISAVVVDGKMRITALYDRSPVGSFYTRTGLTAAEYQLESNSQVAAGRRLSYVNAFMFAGTARFSAIWDQRDSGSWASRHDLSSAGYQSEWTRWTGFGYRTRAVTGYDNGSGNARFAALWSTR